MRVLELCSVNRILSDRPINKLALQNQERTYSSPVNIRKMTIQLINDKISTFDLNGAN